MVNHTINLINDTSVNVDSEEELECGQCGGTPLWMVAKFHSQDFCLVSCMVGHWSGGVDHD